MYFRTNDGTRIYYSEKGEGFPLLLLPGGGFSGQIFNHQIAPLAEKRRVITLDMRSQGKSDRVLHGMRIPRLAMDLKEVVDSLKIDSFDVMGHSLGCSVIYNYIDLFTCARIRKAILIDEPAVLTLNPDWSQEQKLQYGATYDPKENYAFINRMKTNQFKNLKKQMISAMTTPNASENMISFIESCFDISPEAAKLLYSSNLSQDWRDVIRRINIPTLIIGGRASITPWQSQQWISENISGAKLKIFDVEESGSHFMFVENPNLFNHAIQEFL